MPSTITGDDNFTTASGGCTAWVNFDSAGVIADSYNVSSITVVSTGVYDINFTTAMDNTNFAVSVVSDNANSTAFNNQTSVTTAQNTTAKAQVKCVNGGIAQAAGQHIIIFGGKN